MSAFGQAAPEGIPAAEERDKIERQLLLLVEASGTLLASPQASDVLGTVMSLAQRFVAADAYALWRQTSEHTWTAIRTIGLSSAYERQIYTSTVVERIPKLSEQPQVIADVEDSPLVASRLRWYREEGIRSLVTVPLRLHGTLSGTLVFYYRRPHPFTEWEIRIAESLGNLAAAAIGTADLYEHQKTLRSAAETSARRATLLAEIGATLASSLDTTHALEAITALTVPFFADWCGVSVITDGGTIRRLVLRGEGSQANELAREVQQILPPRSLLPVRMAMRFRRPQLVEDISPALLAARIKNPGQADLIRRLGIRSLICVPMMARGRTIGVLTFAMTQAGTSFTSDDLEFAKELGHREAMAIDSSRLFADAQQERERTQKANRDLRAANEALQQANSDLEQFAYSASHDLQEPLRTVAVYSQLLQRHLAGKLDTDGQLFIDYAVSAAKRMEVLVHDLLSYVRATTGVEAAESLLTDANHTVNDVLANLRASIESSGATVVCGQLPGVRVPTVHLRQLFQNLISNAIKYRSEKLPHIEISGRDCGAHCEFAVADNGIGIDPQYATQIFGIFKRLHSLSSYSGTGIGLAICQKIVQRHGGRIWVESEAGKGSTFRFTVPGVEQIS